MPVIVNGVEIADRAIQAEVQYHPASSLERAQEEAARALVVRELLLQAAAARGIERPEPAIDEETGLQETEEEALIRVLLARELEMPEPDEAACRRYYAQNQQRFRSPDLFEAAHILFLADPEDEAATAQAKQQAADVLVRLEADPGSFGELAKELSACPSGAQGGNLGQVTKGQTVPEFETFLFNLEEGQVCPVPVKTRFGYHVLRLDRRIEGRQLPFEMARERIEAYLRAHVWRSAVRQYISLLIGQAEIEGIDIEGARSLLVQ